MKKLSDLHKKNIVVFDCEIKNTIGTNGVNWTTFDKMGISVACLFDYETGDNTVYLEDNLQELKNRLDRAEVIVGYNIIKFDNPLVAATLKCENTWDHKCYDMLVEVRKSTGQAMPKGCKLDDVLHATFGIKKTEDGAQAPIMYQNGKIGRVVSYCLADVRRERMVFEQSYLTGEVKTIVNGIHKMRDYSHVINASVSTKSN